MGTTFVALSVSVKLAPNMPRHGKGLSLSERPCGLGMQAIHRLGVIVYYAKTRLHIKVKCYSLP